jgi:hypothetical protein
MFKKRFLYEQEEEVELNDFQKILALNKRRIHPPDVEFYNSEGKDFSEYIDITYDGILFTFDGLKDYLQFFFPNYYEEGSEGEYEAINYEWMYSGRYDWYDEYYSRASDDWREGYMINSMKSESLMRLKEILNYVAPHLSKYIEVNEGTYSISDSNTSEIVNFLGTLGFEDNISEAYVDSQSAAVRDSAPKYISETYCNCLTDVGIENYSQRHCFWKYEMDWGSAILLFARFGTENDKFLDLLFEGIKNSNVKHLPEYYEIQHYCWDQDEFNETYVRELDYVFDKIEKSIGDSDSYNEEYLEVINKVSAIGGLNEWIESKNKKFQIKLHRIDPETLKIDFNVAGKTYYYQSKRGRSTIDDIINLLNNESLFDVQDFREHYLKLTQKSVL